MNTSLTASIKPQFRMIEGVKIRYADSGGSQRPTVVLTSPWPESLYAFAPIWASLAEHARVFAIDLPGFGASERREDLLSPRAMGGFLAQVIADDRSGPASHRRAGRGDLGCPVRRGGTSGADRERDRGDRRSCGADPAR